jgi:hypothetical protein
MEWLATTSAVSNALQDDAITVILSGTCILVIKSKLKVVSKSLMPVRRNGPINTWFRRTIPNPGTGAPLKPTSRPNKAKTL